MITEEQVLEKLKEIEEPCMPLVNIVDMGLIYSIEIKNGSEVYILMTFISKVCPVGIRLTELVKNKVKELRGISFVEVDLTFDPPWTPGRLSEENRKRLGFI